jgi:hypothetical protein
MAGRPPKYKTPEEMQIAIDKYFLGCEANNVPYTITGLAYALDMTRDQLIKYERKDAFTDTIKKAKLKVENGYELRLIASGRAGDIFALKQFGWSDKQEVDQNVKGEMSINITGQVKDWAK